MKNSKESLVKNVECPVKRRKILIYKLNKNFPLLLIFHWAQTTTIKHRDRRHLVEPSLHVVRLVA